MVMNRSLRTQFALGLIGLLSFVLACEPPLPTEKRTSFEETEAGRQLALKLQGFWDIRSQSYMTDCPVEHVVNPMDGYTRWEADGHQVTIQWITGGMYFMDLWATSSTTLEQANSIEMLGCKVDAEALMTFITLQSHLIEAEYREEYYHNRAEACEVAAEDYDFPDGCELVVQFVGYR